MDTLTDKMKAVRVPATVESFKFKNPSKEKFVCSNQLFPRDRVLVDYSDSPDEPAEMRIVGLWKDPIEDTRTFAINIVEKFPSFVTA